MSDMTLQEYYQKLLAERAALNAAIARVEADLGLAGSGNATVAPLAGAAGPMTGKVRPDEFFKMTTPEAIKRYLEIVKQPQGPKAIADGLKAGGILSEAKHFYANVFTALRRLRDQGAVVNTKTGGWGLVDWYAGRSGAAVAEKPKGKKKGAKGIRKAKLTVVKEKKPATGYRAFIGEQMRAGKNMKEAAAAWRAQKAGA